MSDLLRMLCVGIASGLLAGEFSDGIRTWRFWVILISINLLWMVR